MEGINDGQASDRCFYCALLYPECELCPLCGQRLRYQPAAMMAPLDLENRYRELVKEFQAKPCRESVEALLSFLHRFVDEPVDFLERPDQPTIEALRSAYGPLA